jgi:hypothetical protein
VNVDIICKICTEEVIDVAVKARGRRYRANAVSFLERGIEQDMKESLWIRHLVIQKTQGIDCNSRCSKYDRYWNATNLT